MFPHLVAEKASEKTQTGVILPSLSEILQNAPLKNLPDCSKSSVSKPFLEAFYDILRKQEE
jgi:hypothetical protein